MMFALYTLDGTVCMVIQIIACGLMVRGLGLKLGLGTRNGFYSSFFFGSILKRDEHLCRVHVPRVRVPRVCVPCVCVSCPPGLV